MSYFAAALVALLAAESLMVAGWGFPNAPIGPPATQPSPALVLLLGGLAALGYLQTVPPIFGLTRASLEAHEW